MAKRTGGPKAAALARTRTLNPNPERVVDEAFGSSELFDARDLVQVKYETVRKVEAHGASVSAAAAGLRSLPSVLLHIRRSLGRGRPRRAASGQARSSRGAQAHRRGPQPPRGAAPCQSRPFLRRSGECGGGALRRLGASPLNRALLCLTHRPHHVPIPRPHRCRPCKALARSSPCSPRWHLTTSDQ